jgi:alanine racemase
VDGVAPFLEPYVDYFGVAVLEEGIHLRQLGITKPILVAGGTLPDQIPFFAEYNLILTGSSSELLDAADEYSRSMGIPITVHLKIDTGMERVGVHEYEAEAFIEHTLRLNHLKIEGIYTHLANSEVSDNKYSLMQLERFQAVLHIYAKRSEKVPAIRHMNNSGGIVNLPDANFDLVRPGVLFYGVYPDRDSNRPLNVIPGLRWISQVVYSKLVKPGRPVSYGSLWQAQSETRVVTIPCGYADGYFRRMTNRASVIIQGSTFPQVGRICMDQFMVDTGSEYVGMGDEVVLLGDGISPYDLAEWAGTNAYEILTNISSRVPRVYITE